MYCSWSCGYGEAYDERVNRLRREGKRISKGRMREGKVKDRRYREGNKLKRRVIYILWGSC